MPRIGWSWSSQKAVFKNPTWGTIPASGPRWIWDNGSMQISRVTWRWSALVGLWVLVGAICWLMAIQIFMVLLHSSGMWQRPGIACVTILEIDKDPQNIFTDDLLVQRGEKARAICMLKEECEDANVGDEIWILDNYYATPLRPSQFRLTLWRLLVEYPEPLLFLALLGIWRVRRAQAKAKALLEVPSRTCTTLQDDFHSRARRFAASKEPRCED